MADSSDSSPKRHCWECRRRYLVCDFTQPACKRCIASGVDCPGYSKVKPVRIQWLPPGRVKSRRHKADAAVPAVPAEAGIKKGDARLIAARPMALPPEPPRLAQDSNLRILIECVEYSFDKVNACILQDLLPLQQLGPNPHLYRVTERHIQEAASKPDHIRYGIFCTVLSHRINRSRGATQMPDLEERYFHYRGIAIRSLSEHLSEENNPRGDATLAGIMTVLLLELHHGVSQNWRMHLEVMHQLVALRGGFEKLAASEHLEQFAHCLWHLAVMGNTTCPATSMDNTETHLETLEFVMQRYSSNITSFGFCAAPLIAEMVSINHLRWRIATSETISSLDLWRDAHEILGRVYDFSPERWAESKPLSQEKWTLVGNIFWASVALYCISSLQSICVPPIEIATPAQRATHVQFLHLCLAEAAETPSLRNCMLWPLVVLGVEATGGCDNGAEVRAFVAEKLEMLSRHSGTYGPLTAKRVLETFWRSGETAWDACFDRPYAFTLLISIDVHKMISPGG
ncbi:fungal-specific transcription factor domain-containing protein [Apiospora marii]|uniref:Fungal-specific transcription factor domain-containing protein n=1 Tax=Apiospora marii TaxID=335849 RepID=A0ABR1R7R8_9PEZI